MGIRLVGIKHDMRQEMLSFLEFGNVFLSSSIDDRVRVIET